MPGLVRKLVVVAAIDGLHLHPSANRHQQRPGPSVQIQYATNSISALEATGPEPGAASSSFEAHGIVGLFTVASSSWLVAVASRRQVAQIRGKPVYVITGVALVPLSSQADAKRAIDQVKQNLLKRSKVGSATPSDGDTSEDEDANIGSGYISQEEGTGEVTVPSTPDVNERGPILGAEPGQKISSIIQDVIGKKGQYGRFAERWFSKKGWSVEKRRMQGMSADSIGQDASLDAEPSLPPEIRLQPGGNLDGVNDRPGRPNIKSIMDGKNPTVSNAASLLPKLLRTTKILLASESFFFSYDCDITRRLGTESKRTDVPLYQVVDPLFFWNRHLLAPLIQSGQQAFVLPIMQGFVGQRAFTANTELKDVDRIAVVKEAPGEVIEMRENALHTSEFFPTANNREFLITLISRRSIKRFGLRYLRRGLDDEGHAANTVETEQILSDLTWATTTSTYSFTQIRGSIPLYFSQSPYSFKPVPVINHSFETNHAAFKRHFTELVDRYGGVQIALLVDKHGVEAKIGEEFEKHATLLNEENGINGQKPGFEWFDFHSICRGMKFEKVEILMDSLAPTLKTMGTAIEMNGKVQETQTGILRTNCMDCLDRTNVVQSATAQRALEQQLLAEGIALNLQTDASTQWFNTLWADNGDAISKQYSSTAALKGDYTRTRKRDYRGAINDFGLTLSRYFNNIVNDYFSQAAIDYLLGNVTDQVFEEFEANMMSGDPALSMRKVRQTAIDTSAKIAIADPNEELRSGWTLLSPREPNTVRSSPFEEVVLLLTDTALYAVRFDWNMEKVTSFERVHLSNVVSISRGAYITSTLAATQMDEKRNVGFLVRYRPGPGTGEKVNTRSLSTAATPRQASFDASDGQPPAAAATTTTTTTNTPDPARDALSTTELRLLAFKAPPAQSSSARANTPNGEAEGSVSEGELVRVVCAEIGHAVGERGAVEMRDVISLADARKSTGLWEHWGHEIKKLVWA